MTASRYVSIRKGPGTSKSIIVEWPERLVPGPIDWGIRAGAILGFILFFMGRPSYGIGFGLFQLIGILLLLLGMFNFSGRSRKIDGWFRVWSTRSVFILENGTMTAPNGLPKQWHAGPDVIPHDFFDVVNISVEDGPPQEKTFLIVLTGKNGDPVVLSESTRPRIMLNPIIIALEKAFNTMRPIVQANVASKEKQ